MARTTGWIPTSSEKPDKLKPDAKKTKPASSSKSRRRQAGTKKSK